MTPQNGKQLNHFHNSNCEGNMKYKDLAEQLLKCCLALRKDNVLQTKKIKAQPEVIETMVTVMIDHGLLKREPAKRQMRIAK